MKLLEKTELSNTLKALIGNRPVHNLPATLNKDDIVLYNDYLYKCKNPGEYSIIDSTNFKPIGLRFRTTDFKINLFPNMEEFYYRMYQIGVNGNKQKDSWVDPSLGGRGYLHVRDKKHLNDMKFSHNISFSTFVNIFNVSPNEVLTNKKTKRKANFRESDSLSLSDISRNYTMDVGLIYNISKFEEERIRVFNILDELYKGKTSISALLQVNNELTELELYENISVGTYEIPLYNNMNIIPNYLSHNLIEKDDFNFGTYQKISVVEGSNRLTIQQSNNSLTSYFYYHEERDSEGSIRDSGYIFKGIRESDVFSRNISSIARHRYWLPNFDEIDNDDNNSNSARRLNRDFNHYGVFIKPKTEGKYKFKFKVVFTNRNQHEERPWGNSWGNRYAYYLHDTTTETNPERVPSNTKVRGNDTWLFWVDKYIYDGILTFNFVNNTIESSSIVLKGNDGWINSLKPEIRFEIINNIILLKVFYAVRSIDDAGGWNEWQFAHIIAPFDLEFEGE